MWIKYYIRLINRIYKMLNKRLKKETIKVRRIKNMRIYDYDFYVHSSIIIINYLFQLVI